MGCVVRTFVLALAAAAAAPQALGQSHAGEPKDMTIEDLKAIYLWCNGPTSGKLHTVDVMRCSVVYEALKRRAFDGDFEKLLAWSRVQSASQGR